MYAHVHACTCTSTVVACLLVHQKTFHMIDPHYRDEVNFIVPPEFKPIVNWKQSPKAPLISDPTCWQANPLLKGTLKSILLLSSDLYVHCTMYVPCN